MYPQRTYDVILRLVYGHRGEQRVVAKGETQSAVWGEAVRMAGLVDG